MSHTCRLLIYHCSGVNIEPDEPSPLQAWAAAMSPIDESPMKRAGGEPARHSDTQVRQGISRVQSTSGRLLLDLMVGPTSPTSSYGQLFVRGRSQPTCLHRSGVLAACGPDGFGQVNLLKWAQGGPYLWAQESGTNTAPTQSCGCQQVHSARRKVPVGSFSSPPSPTRTPVPSSSSPSVASSISGRAFPEFNRVFILLLYNLVVSFVFDLRVSELGRSAHRAISEFLFLSGFVNMARGDVNVKPTNVPEDMDWVDDLVLLSKAVEGVRPFYENERGEYQFRLYWYSGPESPKFDFDDLDETDQEIETVLSQCCARVPFNTKVLLTQSLSYIRTELEKMTNNSDAYRRMRARKKNQANRLAPTSGSKDNSKGSSSPVNRAPPPGSENQSVPTGPKLSLPPRVPSSRLIECPPTSRANLEQLKEKVAALEKGKEDAEGELSEARAELTKMKKSAKKADRLRKKAEADATELRKKVESLEVDLAKQKEEYEELEDDSIKSNDNIVENLRLQAKILVPTLKVHLLHPDNYVVGDQIVWCANLLPESGGPFFEEEAAEVGNAEKSEPQSGANDAEKTPHV
ncbi:hypothetical protein PIB30_017997 [Stylosanthes scabra]|uniref:Uncharacterized protein n=1 Tax=Stylosanthes scabra TaxID=79078 RepID=A0ABU6U842_9FABA|nr:hypothetical protein [Stylosanthes scabra]